MLKFANLILLCKAPDEKRLSKKCRKASKYSDTSAPYHTLNEYNLLNFVVSKNCWMSGKHCRLWWDAAYCGASSGSTLFAQAEWRWTCSYRYLFLAIKLQNEWFCIGIVVSDQRAQIIRLVLIFTVWLYTCFILSFLCFKRVLDKYIFLYKYVSHNVRNVPSNMCV